MPKSTSITEKSAKTLLNQLNEQIVSRAWNVYGYTLFLELGELDEEDRGEITIMIQTNWEIYHNNELYVDITAEPVGEVPELELLVGKRILKFSCVPQETTIQLEDCVAIKIVGIDKISKKSRRNLWSVRFKNDQFWLVARKNGKFATERT